MSIIKRKVVSENLCDYSFGLLGESGIGKTTTMVEICEKEFGEDGYAILNMGKEQGIDCLEGAAYVDIPDWKHFAAACKDFIENKETEYPNLKVLVVDTLDQLIEITEPHIISMWNKENLGKQGFSPAKTMNAAWSGFGRAEDKLIQVLLDMIWKLKKVGITVWYTAHVKQREQIDAYTGQSYNVLSTNMMQKYFNGFKTKIHVVGIACVDRTIETEKTGRKNIVSNKDITVNKIKSERRKVIFRDDNYGVDSKSRFADIVNEVNLDSDEIIKALKDAIKASKSNKITTAKVEQQEVEKIETKKSEIKKNQEVKSDDLPEEFDDMFDEEPEETIDYKKEIQKLFKSKDTDKEKIAEVRATIKEYGRISSVPQDVLVEIYNTLIA